MSSQDRSAEPGIDGKATAWERLETAFQIRRRDEAGPAGRSRVLIHAMHSAPEVTGPGRFTGELAAHLAADGHAVEVVTTPPHYPGWYVRPPYKGGRYSREVRDGVTVYRCPILLKRNCTGIWRLIAPLSFAIAAAPVVIWRILRHRPHVVVCNEPTLFCAPAAFITAKLVGARTVLHVQDFEVDAAFAVGHLPDGVHRRFAEWYERALLLRFGSVVTISGKMRSRLLEKGVDSRRIHIARNWVDTTRIKPAYGENGYRRELELPEDAVVVLYAGQMGPKQGLRSLLEAADLLAEEPKVHVVIAGDGPIKAQLVLEYGERPNVHFLPVQPEERLCELLNLADIHALPQSKGIADLVLPSKLGGMLASRGQLVVAADPGTEMHDILEGHAVLVAPGSSEALADGIRLAISAPREKDVGHAETVFSKPRNLGAFLTALGLPQSGASEGGSDARAAPVSGDRSGNGSDRSQATGG